MACHLCHHYHVLIFRDRKGLPGHPDRFLNHILQHDLDENNYVFVLINLLVMDTSLQLHSKAIHCTTYSLQQRHNQLKKINRKMNIQETVFRFLLRLSHKHKNPCALQKYFNTRGKKPKQGVCRAHILRNEES